MKDEFAFISRISPTKTNQPSLVQGIGDDAAVYQGSGKMDEVVCVDTMVEGVHFRKDTLSPYQIGKKSLAINVSDLAAMGAIPAYYLVSIAISPSWQEEELAEIYRGMDELALQYNMDLIGGDTVSTGDALVLTVTVIGRVERDQARYRHQAKAGDVLFLTGYVGTSAAGLDLLFEKGLDGEYTADEQFLVRAHQEPSPHVEAGRILATFHERVSLNDVSDGVASEANELAEASKVQITIDADALPFHESMKDFSRKKQLDWALFGGEDFVLIGTVAKEHADGLSEQFRAYHLPFHQIGMVEAGEPSVFLKEGHQVTRLEKHGYNHFQKRG